MNIIVLFLAKVIQQEYFQCRFGAVVSIYGSRTVYVGLPTIIMLKVMNDHVTQCNHVDNCYVFVAVFGQQFYDTEE